MTNNREFSELFEAYNQNIASISEARKVFEEELQNLNDLVKEYLIDFETKGSRTDSNIKKCRWHKPKEFSSGKDGSWIKTFAGVRITVDVRKPNKPSFNNDAGYLYFVARFEEDLGKFMFRCRFQNNNNADSQIDEKIINLVEHSNNDAFTGYKGVKSNDVYIFRQELNNELFENLDTHIEQALTICEKAVGEIYPDSLWPLEDNDASTYTEEPKVNAMG